jgi:NAD(P)-dependent dehydrogenase (short-subunit alcohol dehydrogenase family)
MRQALVLGGTDSRSIGHAIQRYFVATGHWNCDLNNCEDDLGEYNIPSMENYHDLDALVVAIGACHVEKITRQTDEQIADVIRANLTLPVLAAKEFMHTQKQGSIVFIGSYNHDHVLGNGTPYCASKAGLDMAVKSLAWESSPAYSFFCVHPYQIPDTKMSERIKQQIAISEGRTQQEVYEYSTRDRKLPFDLRTQDVAMVVWQLVTSPAQNWLSGTSINMYGGVR